jgi:hypothetical protein
VARGPCTPGMAGQHSDQMRSGEGASFVRQQLLPSQHSCASLYTHIPHIHRVFAHVIGRSAGPHSVHRCLVSCLRQLFPVLAPTVESITLVYAICRL